MCSAPVLAKHARNGAPALGRLRHAILGGEAALAELPPFRSPTPHGDSASGGGGPAFPFHFSSRGCPVLVTAFSFPDWGSQNPHPVPRARDKDGEPGT